MFSVVECDIFLFFNIASQTGLVGFCIKDEESDELLCKKHIIIY